MKHAFYIFISLLPNLTFSQYSPGVGEAGCTAIHKDSSIIINWAYEVASINLGPQQITNPSNGLADFGTAENSLGIAEGNSSDIITLGDGGEITLGFEHPIKNGIGPDFAVFENGFDNSFLELAHVDVSTDGIRFVRIPSYSNIPTTSQTSSFGYTDPTLIHNLAGKHKQGYGTPFDLNDIIDSTGIHLDSVNFIRITDVIGSINPNIGTYDSQGNIINDPYPTPFVAGGFDLDAVAVINENTFVAINETNHSKPHINIYPNPTESILNIKLNEDGVIQIYSINGSLVTQLNLKKNETYTIENLENGLYFIRANIREKIITKKIIVKQ